MIQDANSLRGGEGGGVVVLNPKGGSGGRLSSLLSRLRRLGKKPPLRG